MRKMATSAKKGKGEGNCATRVRKSVQISATKIKYSYVFHFFKLIVTSITCQRTSTPVH